MPLVASDDELYVVDVPNLSTVTTVRLKESVGSLESFHEELKEAMGFLFTGF